LCIGLVPFIGYRFPEKVISERTRRASAPAGLIQTGLNPIGLEKIVFDLDFFLIRKNFSLGA